MIDSQGRVFITDFGLAAVTGELREAQAREGTPAYMAPEQLAGTEVTARSDIYSLGLVLYEMFAGKRPFEAGTLAEMVRLQQQSAPASLTTVLKDVDPAVERIIRRCLAADPRQRPATALAVAAAFPGGDPLAAALAAGETPSPDLVAAAGQQVGIRPALGLDCVPRADDLQGGHGTSAGSARGKEPRSGARAGIHSQAHGNGARVCL